MTTIIIALAALFGGLLWRVRGGWMGRYNPGGTQAARAVAVAPMMLLGGLLGGWWGALAAFWNFPELMVTGWWDAMAVKVWSHWLKLSARGLVQVLLPALTLWWAGFSHWWLVLPGGIAFGTLFMIAWCFDWPPIGPKNNRFIDGPNSIVEISWGATLYGTLAAALLL